MTNAKGQMPNKAQMSNEVRNPNLKHQAPSPKQIQTLKIKNQNDQSKWRNLGKRQIESVGA
jgi:hypothetical protein